METEILQQRAATHLNVESSIMALSPEHATELFIGATNRLLNISKWHTLPCSLLAALRLTDENGHDVDRQVRENDYFVINNQSGEEEWVKIERIYVQRDPSGPREMVTLRARPGGPPHEYNVDPTRPSNTFKVTRHGLNITASVHGLNGEDFFSTTTWPIGSGNLRPQTTVGAIRGLARVHWRSLVNGILSTWQE